MVHRWHRAFSSSRIDDASRTTSPPTAICISIGEGRRRADPCREHRRTDRRLRAFARRQARRIRRRRCRAIPSARYTQPDLWVAELGAGTPRNLTATYDFDINGGIGGDQRAPRGQLPSGPVWSRDGRTILIGAGEQGNANLKRVDVASGRIDPVTSGNERRDVVHRRRRRAEDRLRPFHSRRPSAICTCSTPRPPRRRRS